MGRPRARRQLRLVGSRGLWLGRGLVGFLGLDGGRVELAVGVARLDGLGLLGTGPRILHHVLPSSDYFRAVTGIPGTRLFDVLLRYFPARVLFPGGRDPLAHVHAAVGIFRSVDRVGLHRRLRFSVGGLFFPGNRAGALLESAIQISTGYLLFRGPVLPVGFEGFFRDIVHLPTAVAVRRERRLL